jgi:hypothetical protein
MKVAIATVSDLMPEEKVNVYKMLVALKPSMIRIGGEASAAFVDFIKGILPDSVIVVHPTVWGDEVSGVFYSPVMDPDDVVQSMFDCDAFILVTRRGLGSDSVMHKMSDYAYAKLGTNVFNVLFAACTGCVEAAEALGNEASL